MVKFWHNVDLLEFLLLEVLFDFGHCCLLLKFNNYIYIIVEGVYIILFCSTLLNGMGHGNHGPIL